MRELSSGELADRHAVGLAPGVGLAGGRTPEQLLVFGADADDVDRFGAMVADIGGVIVRVGGEQIDAVR